MPSRYHIYKHNHNNMPTIQNFVTKFPSTLNMGHQLLLESFVFKMSIGPVKSRLLPWTKCNGYEGFGFYCIRLSTYATEQTSVM
jgi:hypothetical protein